MCVYSGDMYTVFEDVSFCLYTLIMLLFLVYGRGGGGKGLGQPGDNGTITGIVCPIGLYGILCEVDLFLFNPSYLWF